MSNNDLIQELVKLSEELRSSARYYSIYDSTPYNRDRMPCFEREKNVVSTLESTASKIEKLVAQHVVANGASSQNFLSRRVNSLVRWEMSKV